VPARRVFLGLDVSIDALECAGNNLGAYRAVCVYGAAQGGSFPYFPIVLRSFTCITSGRLSDHRVSFNFIFLDTHSFLTSCITTI